MKSILLASLFILVAAAGLSGQEKWKKRFRLPMILNEVSGLLYAAPDSLWWHNDSGDDPVLYLTDGNGKLIRKETLGTLKNVDWEDITVDDYGRIYIGDFGNGSNRRKDLRIYRYEPETGQVDSLVFSYEDQLEFPPPPERSNFDMEAFFWLNDSLHLFSKNLLQKGNYQCKHYVLSATMEDQVARVRDSIFLRKRVITAAAISPDRKTVALIGYNYKLFLGFLPTSAASIFVFSDFSGSDFFLGRMKRKAISCIVATQYEAVDFIDNDQVYIASEKTAFVPPRVKRKRVGKKKLSQVKNP